MAFSQSNSRELQNRKILEELQLKKQMLLKQGVAPTLNTSLGVSSTGSASSITATQSNDGVAISASQRAALHNAHAASFGYFVTQDSSFGNLILPVLPRFDILIIMAGLRLGQLEEYLQQLDVFEKPKISLEQYATSAHIASHLLYTAQSQFDDIKSKSIADLGSGCGTLSLGAKMLGAEYVVGFEIDSNAVDIQYRNCSDIELFVEIVQCDVLQYLPGRFEKYFDTVIMNPPFGTKNNPGIDIKFLETAIKLSSNAVYSLHKSSTRDYVLSKATQLGARGTVIAELRYDLPRAYKFHKKASVDIQVDFIRFELKR
ncbi:methyltransferase-like protein 5 [Temnothorax curvispinosus]|uniref:Methyltransferase-like protein 5 n=2 Tax=Temnothorax TaxID=300110 RepID=A0A6J1Q9F7_9HYME|nr:methyltransferase-like protein 5 [Temnothorax curvispinosus]